MKPTYLINKNLLIRCDYPQLVMRFKLLDDGGYIYESSFIDTSPKDGVKRCELIHEAADYWFKHTNNIPSKL